MSYCLECLKKVEYDIIEKTETVTVKELSVTEVQQICICKNCGSRVWVKDIENKNLLKLYDNYRVAKGLLFPEEIIKKREKYNLSQAEFADILGIKEKQIRSYESGSIPDDAINNLIYLLSFDDNFNALCYKHKK